MLMFYAIIIVLCISLDKSIIRTRSLEIHIHKRHNIYPGKPSRGRKPSKNFLIINSLYNVQEITQTNTESPPQEMHHPSSPLLQLVNATCLIRE
jgi:hypothetical protein